MKNRSLFAASLLLVSVTAFATNVTPFAGNSNAHAGASASSVGVGVGVGAAIVDVDVTNKNTNSNANKNINTNTIKAVGGTGIGGASDASATSGVGDVSLVGGSISNRVDTKYIAPPVYVDSSNNTMNCLRTIGLAASGASDGGAGGTSLGYSVKDGDCQLQQDENDAFAKGDTATGWALFCRKTTIMEVFGYKKGSLWKLRGTKGNREQAIQACMDSKKI